MQTPLQITFHGLPRSDALEAKIREKAAKLEEFHPAIISCRVVVEEQRRHHHQGRQFVVRIDVRVPGHEFDVTRDHNEDVYVALRDAFDASKRVLEDDIRMRRGDVKTHDIPLHGRIARLDMDQGHGYIETDEGGEVYFSRENVANPPFEHLEVGSEVEFLLEPGKNTMLARRVTARKHRFGG
jgi:ribosome-associated translation inhibitor RaiA/cold shock CspA family protein